MSQDRRASPGPFDLTARGHRETSPAPGASVDFHHIYFQGALGTATEGIRGEKNIPAGSSNHSLMFRLASMNVALRTYYLSPPPALEIWVHRVTIP